MASKLHLRRKSRAGCSKPFPRTAGVWRAFWRSKQELCVGSVRKKTFGCVCDLNIVAQIDTVVYFYGWVLRGSFVVWSLQVSDSVWVREPKILMCCVIILGPPSFVGGHLGANVYETCRDWSSMSHCHGSFLEWSYPNSSLDGLISWEHSTTKMDDHWGYPHDFGNGPYLFDFCR